MSRLLAGVGAVLLVIAGFTATAARGAGEPDAGPTPQAACGPGSHPESTQGRVSLTDINNGRAAEGYRCNTQELSHFGTTGGYKVERYIDPAGHECAYYDTTLLFPANVFTGNTGVYVLDMTDPAHPVQTATLSTPAMQSPHESVLLNTKRGILAAVMGNPTFYPGIVDIYDLTQDCRHPVLKASAPVGLLGHESGFAPDGNTFYAASLFGGTLTAIDVSNESVPVTLWVGNYYSHGLSISEDGRRAYVAARSGVGADNKAGLIVLDTSQIQDRVTNPQVPVVSSLTWPLVSTPQTTIPVTINHHPYLIEIDEFASGDNVGAGRIIDMADEKNPRVVSNFRLAVNQASARQGDQANDPGASNSLQGYAGHYCSVPDRTEPGVVACSFILSGLRLFDIRDPLHPKELAYFNAPVHPSSTGGAGSNYAMSSPAFAVNRGEIWYTDGNDGFYAVKVTNGVWPFTSGSTVAAAPKASSGVKSSAARPSGALPATGTSVPLAGLGATLLALAYVLRRAST